MSKLLIAAALISLVACNQVPGHQIEQLDTGYSVGDLPDDILEGFPQEHRIMLTLEDGDATTSVTGLASVVDGVLMILTDDTLAFTSGSDDTYLLLMSVEGTVVAANWTGCPANPALKVYRDNPKTCWCWSDGAA